MEILGPALDLRHLQRRGYNSSPIVSVIEDEREEKKVPLCSKKMVGVARFELATPSPPD